MERLRLIVLDEITAVIGEEWTTLNYYSKGFTAKHTLLVLWRCKQLPDFLQLTTAEQNLVLWAALLHDVRKLKMPAIQGKDHIHPFKSASSVLDVFQSLKLIEGDFV
jgi:response regulator RpfG family c-di-GMP phosphodiesterase